MKVAKIELTNFKKFKNLTVDFGTKTRISGYNETGKSTIVDSFFWLFFGKSSTGISDISFPKPIINGELQRQTDVTVEAIVDGVTYSRTLKEKWTKKRGTAEKEFTGHETLFEIDGVPVKKKDFDNTVKILFGDDKLFKLLSDTTAVMNMKWDERRKLLVKDNGAIEFLTQELIAKKASRKKLNEKCEELPARIDELSNSISGIKEDEEKVATLRAELTEQQNQLASAQNSGVSLETKERIATVKAKINDILGQINREISNARSENFQRVRDLNTKYGAIKNQKEEEANANRNRVNNELNELKAEEQRLTNEVLQYNQRIQGLQENKRSLLEQYHEEKSKEYDESKDTCVTCGQSLPLERVNTARENFNTAKSNNLTDLIQRGTEVASQIEIINSQIFEKNKQVTELSQQIEAFQVPEFVQVSEHNCNELKQIMDEITSLQNTEPQAPQNLIDEKSLAETDLRQLETSLSDSQGGANDIIKYLISKVQETQNELNEAVETNAKARAEAANKKRVEELREELLRIGEELNKKEFEIVEIENKIKDEVLSAESALNAKFRIVEWKLYEQQINGALAPCCTPMVDGIEYKLLNTAKQINVGIDIINTLSKERGVNYPLFIDNAESNLNIEPTGSQVIELYVRDEKELKFEILEA